MLRLGDTMLPWICLYAVVDVLLGSDLAQLRPQSAEEGQETTGRAAEEESIVAAAKKQMPEREHALLDLFQEALGGEFAEDLAKICGDSKAEHQKILEALEKDQETGLGQRVATACAALSEKKVEEKKAFAPSLSVRQLARMGSDSDTLEAERLQRAQRERDELWEKAVAVRKTHVKIVNLAEIKPKKPTTASEFVKVILHNRSSKSELALNEKHRGVFVSADLISDGDPPWSVATMWKDGQQKFKLSLATVGELGQREAEFHFLFDGRNRDSRKQMEDTFQKVPNTEICELWLSYSKAGSVGPVWKVFGSDVAREIGLVRLPAARVRLSCNPREDDFCRSDDATTADCTYEGVEPQAVPWVALIRALLWWFLCFSSAFAGGMLFLFKLANFCCIICFWRAPRCSACRGSLGSRKRPSTTCRQSTLMPLTAGPRTPCRSSSVSSFLAKIWRPAFVEGAPRPRKNKGQAHLFLQKHHL